LIHSCSQNLCARYAFRQPIPEETLEATITFFEACAAEGLGPESLGIGSFGPIDPDPASRTWGYITSTPKPGWKNTDIAGILGRRLGIPVGFDTDVNAAALAEAAMGAGLGLDPVLYLTIGTGIGGGALVNGKLLHGLMHPEMGHIRVARHKATIFRVAVLTIRTAWRAWLPARQWKSAGECEASNSGLTIQPGIWKPGTWPRASSPWP
jgi:predicted NBD/HSP70 family sugar kinase